MDIPFIRNITSLAMVVSLLIIICACSRSKFSDKTSTSQEPETRESSIVLENRTFRLKIDTINGLNPYSLFDKGNNIVLANGDYYYGFGRPREVKVKTGQVSEHVREVTFSGKVNGIRVSHVFRIPDDQEWFEEYVVLKNLNDEVLDLDREKLNLRHGFTSMIGDAVGGNVLNSNWRFMAVPYLLNTGSGKKQEYKIGDLICTEPNQLASEGWVLTNDKAGCLVIKYAQQQMEYSLIDNYLPNVEFGDADPKPTMVWGGSGIYWGDPEVAMRLVSNQTMQTGMNRYISFTGSWKLGYSLFKSFMDGKGHRFPQDFNPPVHWNEIYDNPLWWDAPDVPEKRAKYYRLEDMEKEAVKAVELGCEAIYLDPGWDTEMGSTQWADDRLLSCKEFCDLMKEKYNLKVALHVPLAVWNDPSTYPESARKPFPVNNNYLCSGAPGWWDTKLERLLKLASDGIVYFMFDGTNFTGPCEVMEHRHSVPYTREEHIRNYARLANEVKKKFPDVLIEMHDQILGPTTSRYVPTYYTHHAKNFDAIWAFEYMWDPMHDLTSGLSKSLYYYNLSYNIPLYAHVNLKTDNKNALMFWWYASTCRYLGMGGRYGVKASPPSVEVQYAHLGIGEKNSPPPEIWEAQKVAMKTYMRLKPFFVRGDFYGIDELTHVHTLPEKNSSIINCFNLEDEMIPKEFSVPLAELGLEPRDVWQVKGANKWEIVDHVIHIVVELPANGMQLIEINPK